MADDWGQRPDPEDDLGDGDAADLARLETELGLLAREVTDNDAERETPPPDLWSMIEATAFADSPTNDDTAPFDGPSFEEMGAARIRTSRIGVQRGMDRGRRRSGVAAAPQPSTRTGLYGVPALLAVAAVVALVLATGAALIVRATNADEVLAEAAIGNDGLPVPFDGVGDAVIKQHDDDLFLELDLPSLSELDQDSIYEVWLIDQNIEGMISLGGLGTPDGDTVRIDLPDNIDREQFPVLDISVEPLDGDPTHSGQSILRGVLTDPENA